MEVIKNLTSALSDIKDNINVRTTPTSISSFAAKSTYYFPVLCSRDVTPETAGLVSKSLERVYTSFVRACFAMMPAMVVHGDVVNVQEYLKLFHQNIGINSDGELIFTVNESATEPWEMFSNDILNEASLKNVSNLIKTTYDENKKDQYSSDVKKSTDATSVYNKVQYKDNDYKKTNEMMPSIVEVSAEFIIKDNKTDKPISVNIPVGVKTQLHSMNTPELDGRIMDSIAGKGVIHSLIRWYTGEVLSLKDILFGTTKMKNNISNKNSDVAKWFDALEHRKRLSSLSTPALSRKAYLPNTSIIITIDEVNEISRQVGYNLLNDKSRTAKFIKDNFLLSFAVVNNSSETLWVMYDGHSDFEEYPYSSLARENARGDKDMSNLIKAMANMR